MLVDLKAQRKRARQERDRQRGRLGSGRFEVLAKELARVIRLAFEAGETGSLFGLEGPLRAGIRADLCRQGWTWETADLMVRDLLNEAFRLAKATRPTWNEGQLEWTREAGTLIERTHCARCNKQLPEGRPKFCSVLCKSSHHGHVGWMKQANEDRIVRSSILWI